MVRRSRAGLLLCLCFARPLAAAEPASSNKAAAEALFSEARKLMSAGRYAEACPKLEASNRLDPGIGTMLNLAECYEKTGRTASAWAEFREVISAAKAAESKQREELARQRAEALETRLSRLTITLSPETASLRSVELRRDGALVDSAEIGSPIPVDPGTHVIEATAPGKQKWLRKLEIGADGASETVVIPPLADAVDSTQAVQAAPTEPDRATATTSGGFPQRTLAIAAGAVGLVGVGVGAFFGLRAQSTWDDAKGKCQDYPNECGPDGVKLADDARSEATISTVGFVVGAVGVAAGTVLWFTAAPSKPESPAVGLGPSRIVVRGRF